MSSKQTNISISKDSVKPFNVPNVLYENRYCNQDDFSILVCGGNNENDTTLNDVYELKGPNFECSKFPSMLEARYDCKTAVINSDIVVIGGYNEADNNMYSVEILGNNTKSWFHKTELTDKRENFCICCFKQNLYLIGGNNNGQRLKSCFIYNMKHDTWSQIADVNEQRDNAACTVYEGKIFVTGGIGKFSVEAYDYYENKWTCLPDMNEKKELIMLQLVWVIKCL